LLFPPCLVASDPPAPSPPRLKFSFFYGIPLRAPLHSFLLPLYLQRVISLFSFFYGSVQIVRLPSRLFFLISLSTFFFFSVLSEPWLVRPYLLPPPPRPPLPPPRPRSLPDVSRAWMPRNRYFFFRASNPFVSVLSPLFSCVFFFHDPSLPAFPLTGLFVCSPQSFPYAEASFWSFF